MKYILILLLITAKLTFSQPSTNVEELYRGRHIIKGGTYGHPYTTFDRHNKDANFMVTINKIRRIIIEESTTSFKPVYDAYLALYNNAKGPMPTDKGMITYNSNGDKIGPSDLAV